MNPYTSFWTGRAAGRRAAGVPPRAARQRPHRRAGRPGRAPGAALHPLLGVPERVPGLLARRRPRLRVGLSRADRGDPDAAAARACAEGRSLPYASSLCGACYEVCPVEIDIPRVLVHLRGRVVDTEPAWKPEKAAMKGLYRAFASRRSFEAAQRAARLGRGRWRAAGASRGCPGRCRAGRARATCPEPPAETFRDWWRRERGEPATAPPRESTLPPMTRKRRAAREAQAALASGAASRRTATPARPSLAASVQRSRTGRPRWRCRATTGAASERARARDRRPVRRARRRVPRHRRAAPPRPS